jgi:transcriptional regulator with XRE-family HTH domain
MARPQPALGRRLKALRVTRGLSLKEVGIGTGLSTSFLSMVENGRTELTVGRLVCLLDFHGVELRDLLPERDTHQPVVLRSTDRQVVDSSDTHVRTEPLAAWHYGDMATGFLRFEAGAELAEVAAEPGPKFVFVLAGELMIDFDDSSVVLREGDSVWFEASRLHRHINVGDGEAHVISFDNAASNDVLGGARVNRKK